jgi:hypothetical protein
LIVRSAACAGPNETANVHAAIVIAFVILSCIVILPYRLRIVPDA